MAKDLQKELSTAIDGLNTEVDKIEKEINAIDFWLDQRSSLVYNKKPLKAMDRVGLLVVWRQLWIENQAYEASLEKFNSAPNYDPHLIDAVEKLIERKKLEGDLAALNAKIKRADGYFDNDTRLERFLADL